MNALNISATLVYIFSFLLLVFLILIFYFYKSLKLKDSEVKRERAETARRIYELAILKELGERAGYSLNIEEILQIITGSLRQFISYSAVAYIVIKPEQLKLNIYLDQSVDPFFLKDMKARMLDSLSALSDKNFKELSIDEVVSGAIVVESVNKDIGSFFNIPMVIAGKLSGVLTIAHTDKGLYKEEDMTILYKITSQASEAVSRLQEVVKIEQGKLNAMVESMGDGVLMVDTEYRVMVANPAIKRIINFSEDKEINIFDFVDALGGKFDIHGRLDEAITKKSSYLSDRLNIEQSYFKVGVYPVTHSFTKGGSQILGAVVVFRDITRDIELERVREEFTSMIVHELRSPLDGIKKIIELIVSGSVKKTSKQFGEYMTMAHQSSSSMLELVNDILDLSKLQAGKFEITKEKGSISEVIENRISFYKISADGKKIKISENLSENLPKLSEFDPQAIKQILNNFISNSLKFTLEGGEIYISAFALNKGEEIPLDIKLPTNMCFPKASDLNVGNPSLCVVVSDTGAGIPANSLKDLFHTYKQAKISPVDKESKGTGLGLVIAKGIAEAHGGGVGVVSKEKQGSSFFFTIAS